MTVLVHEYVTCHGDDVCRGCFAVQGALLARLTASGAIEENPAMAEAMLAKRPAVGSLKKLRRRLEQVNTDVYTAWEDGANNLDVEDDTSVASDAPPVV